MSDSLPSSGEASSYRYWAFISYSSKDRAWGRWLHRAIETYGIPAQLVSHPTPAGHPAPKRFHPLFRDREELPASADLGAQLEEALHASRYLIVVCSRHAAQSRWVNKEIETFQQFDRHGRVLAIIVDGEPNAGDECECFPPALRQFEPIAADARPQGDGKANAKLKLLAGMLGVSFDALKQRDTHRQIRRLQVAVVAASLVVISLAGMAWYSNQQRNKAVKARQQAEGILEYLLYDLRDKLEPVGRLDIVHDVQKRVDEYYRQLGLEERDANTLRNRGGAFENEGDRLLAQGDLARALKAYREELAISQRLVVSDPSNAMWQRDLSLSHHKLGDVMQAQGDRSGALKTYRECQTILERLAVSDPSNAMWQRDLSLSQEKVGEVLLAQGDLSGALKAVRKAQSIHQRLAAADPSNPVWQNDLSLSQRRIGAVLKAQGDLGAALQAFREAQTIMQRLALSDPSNTVSQRELAVGQGEIGDVLRAQGDLAGALRAFRETQTILQGLAAADLTNAGWQRDLSLGHLKIGDVLQAQGDLVGALKAFVDAQTIMQRLAVSDPSNVGWQDILSVSQERISDVLQAQGDLVGALKGCRDSLAVRKRLAATDSSNTAWQRNLFVSYWRMANVVEKSGTTNALEWWRQAYDQLSGMKQRGIMTTNDEQYLLVLQKKAGR
jgi:tetratricopeptide (TPR) repeat protein